MGWCGGLMGYWGGSGGLNGGLGRNGRNRQRPTALRFVVRERSISKETKSTCGPPTATASTGKPLAHKGYQSLYTYATSSEVLTGSWPDDHLRMRLALPGSFPWPSPGWGAAALTANAS